MPLLRNGQHLYNIKHQLMSRPVSLRIFSEVLYVSDYDRNCVLSFTLSGDYVGSFGQKYLKGPEGLTIDEDGFFYISNDPTGIFVF